jgi:hypothetical protein
MAQGYRPTWRTASLERGRISLARCRPPISTASLGSSLTMTRSRDRTLSEELCYSGNAQQTPDRIEMCSAVGAQLSCATNVKIRPAPIRRFPPTELPSACAAPGDRSRSGANKFFALFASVFRAYVNSGSTSLCLRRAVRELWAGRGVIRYPCSVRATGRPTALAKSATR